jgi:serine protease Do
VWVAGLAAGSPAATADLLPGDIITSMNGLPIGTDGTFKDYCDVIRTAGDKPIAIEVLRYDTSEVLRGEINGEQPIELAFSFADVIEDETGVEGGATEYSGYQSITDDTGSIILDVPVEWTDVDTAPADLDGQTIPYIAAAPDRQAFIDTYDVPGVIFVTLPPTDDLNATLAEYAPAEGTCTDLGITDYSDPVYTGVYQVWDACAGTATALVVLAAVPEDNSYLALMLVQLVTEADVTALDQMFATFNYIGG